MSSLRLTRSGRPADNGRAADPRRTTTARPSTQVAARVGLWTLVVLGALGGLVGMVRPSPQPVARASGDDVAATVPPETAGFAELAVTTWVSAQGDDAEEEVGALFAVDPSTNAGDAGRRRVNGDATTVDARRIDDDYWAVTVAAPVDEFVDERWVAAGTWYLEVGVARTDEGLIAVAEPAVVPAPAEPTDAPRPAGEGLGVPAQDDEEMANTVQGFLSALVAGSGDVSRYLAPDVEIAPVTPAPFSEVALQRWAVTPVDEGEARVRLVARATSAAGVPRTVSYELGLAQRAGRWEVTSLSGAPTIDESETVPAPTTTSSTTAPDDATTTVPIVSEPGA
jgi:hypothetical protein